MAIKGVFSDKVVVGPAQEYKPSPGGTINVLVAAPQVFTMAVGVLSVTGAWLQVRVIGRQLAST